MNSNVFLPPESSQTKRKPGRKPNPISPAARKAQNRAAQKAFRERKERHIQTLEVDTKRLLQERDRYLKKNQQLTKENDTLKWENWYLKGMVMSLQLVCFKSKLHIPKHTPYLEDQELQAMTKSIPAPVASYTEITRRFPSPVTNNNNNVVNLSVHLQGVSLLNNDSRPDTNLLTPTNHDSSPTFMDDDDKDMDDAQPIMLMPNVVNNNLVAIQALRLRLRLESAIIREKSSSHTITPTLLQLGVPHDSRIDLIPTPHMRDRMILFRDLFDLDSCLHLLAKEAVFHGGDPSVASNWEVPTSFFEKYWFLTTDYSQQRINRPWTPMHDQRSFPSSKDDQNFSYTWKPDNQNNDNTAAWESTAYQQTSTAAPQVEPFNAIYTNLDPQLLSAIGLPLPSDDIFAQPSPPWIRLHPSSCEHHPPN